MARAASKLTALGLKKEMDPGLYGDGGGLYLQVSTFGTKAWVFRYMIAGRARKMGLGPVSVKPDDKLVTLADARKKAQAARSLVIDGVDPIDDRETRRALQAAQAKVLTFKEAAKRYISDHKDGWKSAKHASQWGATLETYAYPKIGGMPVANIGRSHVLEVIEPIWKTKTETASRVRGRIESVLDWAKSRGYRDGDNPADWGVLKHILPARSAVAPVQNHKALHYSEIPAFMAELRQRDSTSARALELTVLTAARTGDIIGATHTEVSKSERLWTVPAARVKGKKGARKRDHVVPLSDAALAVLESLPEGGDYIFPGASKGKGLSNMAMLELLKGMRPGLTVHGFRSAFKDWASEQTQYPNELSEMALAHTVADKVEAAYRRGDMVEKRRRMMADWAAFCAGVAS